MENNQDKGFTLVELLIVIVILGILATVTVFAVRGITDSGQENACAVELRTLDTAIEAFYAQNQQDPAEAADLSPQYLKEVPNPANWDFNIAVGTGSPEGAGPDGILVDDTNTTVDESADNVPAVVAGSASFTAIADPGKCAGTV